jgi:hypothetical protein
VYKSSAGADIPALVRPGPNGESAHCLSRRERERDVADVGVVTRDYVPTSGLPHSRVHATP